MSFDLSLTSGSVLPLLLLGEFSLVPQFLVVDGEHLSGRLGLRLRHGHGSCLLDHEGRYVLSGDGRFLGGGYAGGEVEVAKLVQLVEKGAHQTADLFLKRGINAGEQVTTLQEGVRVVTVRN